MREIKFRGKHIDNGVWVYGSLLTKFGTQIQDHNSVSGFVEPVNEETVGEFTGLKDRNGDKIYEGDILTYEGITTNGNKVIRIVHFNDQEAKYMAGIYYLHQSTMPLPTIIGNIHDNPELMQ